MKLLPVAVFLLVAHFVFSSATHMTTSAVTWRAEDEVNAMYESWLIKHGKSYNTLGEKENRFQIFKDNLRYIEEHNSGDHSYKLGLNKFSDLTNDEFRSGYTGAIPNRKTNKMTSDRYSLLSGDDLPDSVDWRSKGAVAAVKNQKQCESSWAFSAIGAVEGINQIMTGDLITLSEQELMDCDNTLGNNGCNNGLTANAFKFIIDNGGVDTDDDYPYLAESGDCDSDGKNAKIVSIDGYEDVPKDNESALQMAVANQPIAASIEIAEFSLQTYAGGIYDGPCEFSVNAGVVVVGYGTEDGKDYWLVRNSWGTDWGEEGYIRLERNVKEKTGKCGIATLASYPIKKVGSKPTKPHRGRTRHLI